MKFLKQLATLSTGRILIMAVLLTVGYYFTYFDDGEGLEAQVNNLSAQLAAETANRVSIEKTMKKEEEMRANLLQLQRNLKIVKSKIPNDLKDTEVLHTLNNASSVSGLQIVEISGTSEVQNKVVQVEDINKIKPEDLIEEVKFKISLVGTYNSLLKFLDLLTKEDKIIKVKNFSIEKKSTDIDDEQIKFSGEVISFKQSALSLQQAQGVE